jgi:RHS repeat-associated protein
VKHYFAENERILSNVSGGGNPLIDPYKWLKPLKHEEPEKLSISFTKFAHVYFSDIANMNGCMKNDIELPADISNLPDLQAEFINALNQGVRDKLYYFHGNHLGSGSLITDKQGQTYQTFAYAPHGESLVQINHYSDWFNNPYRYSGKIKDEESGLHYFEMRYLWGEGGIPLSTDPHWYNYPQYGSYVWCGNNPIMFVDTDGRDYSLAFDNKTNTVTISATYYTTASSLVSAQQAASTFNSQSGNFTYTAGKGDAAVSYTVNFNINVVEVAVDSKMGERGSLNVALAADKSGQANLYMVVPDAKMSANENGSTTGGNFVRVKDSRQSTETGAHEMGHTLGLDHSSSGLMTPSSSDSNRSTNIQKSDVKDMLSYPLKGKVNWDYSSSGDKTSTGKGTVINNTGQTNKELSKGRVE